MRVEGPSPTSKWGDMVWGVDNWGDSKNTNFAIGKYISDSLTIADIFGKNSAKTFSETIAVVSRVNFVSLRDGNGYYYVFPDNVTDPDNRYFPTWTDTTDPVDRFTAVSAVSTTWSDA